MMEYLLYLYIADLEFCLFALNQLDRWKVKKVYDMSDYSIAMKLKRVIQYF